MTDVTWLLHDLCVDKHTERATQWIPLTNIHIHVQCTFSLYITIPNHLSVPLLSIIFLYPLMYSSISIFFCHDDIYVRIHCTYSTSIIHIHPWLHWATCTCTCWIHIHCITNAVLFGESWLCGCDVMSKWVLSRRILHPSQYQPLPLCRSMYVCALCN